MDEFTITEWKVTWVRAAYNNEEKRRTETFTTERAARIAFEDALLEAERDRDRGGQIFHPGETIPVKKVLLSTRTVSEWEILDEYPDDEALFFESEGS